VAAARSWKVRRSGNSERESRSAAREIAEEEAVVEEKVVVEEYMAAVVRGERWFRGVEAAAAATVEDEEGAVAAMALFDLHIRLGLGPTMRGGRSANATTNQPTACDAAAAVLSCRYRLANQQA
jgi:hypothetical protein